MKTKSTVDLVNDLAAPLPSIVITDLFGIPIHDRMQFKEWVDILFQPIDTTKKKRKVNGRSKKQQKHIINTFILLSSAKEKI